MLRLVRITEVHSSAKNATSVATPFPDVLGCSREGHPEKQNMPEDNLFTKIIHGEIPCDKVYEDEYTFAFRDINPAAPVHVLVVPKKPIPTVLDAEAEDAELLGRLLLTANIVARQEGIAESGVRYVINNNRDAGQEVYHIHVHVLGGRKLSWPPG